MKPVTDDLYKKIIRLSQQVKEDLHSKGLVIPIDYPDGSVKVGSYRIIKNSSNFYTILDHRNETVIDGINLPQTAAVVANGLALGKYTDYDLIKKDRSYGYALFEEQLHKRAVDKSKTKSLEYFELMSIKYSSARTKKEQYKRDIDRSFEKLKNI